MTGVTGPAPEWVLRADASATIGVGHVMRCLALAEAATARGRRCRLLTHDLPPALTRRATVAGVEVVACVAEPGSVTDGVETAAVAAGAEALVIDGYHFGAVHRSGLTAFSGLRVGIDDNLEADPDELDIVVNQGPHARAEAYLGRARIALLGPRYALLRSEITRLVPVARDDRPARTVVVVMGGSDVGGHSGPIAEAVVAASDLRVLLMTGLANPRQGELRGRLSSDTGRIRPLAPDELPSALAAADIGVIAAGGTLWEAAALGLPTVAVVTVDNQLALTETAEVRSFSTVRDLRGATGVEGIIADVLALAADTARRGAASRCAAALVDGQGAERVVDAVLAAAEGRRGARA